MDSARSLAGIEHILKGREQQYDLAVLEGTWHQAIGMYGVRLHNTGVPLVEHVLAVTTALAEFCPDSEALQACMLHHALEAGVPLLELQKLHTPAVVGIIRGVHLLSYVTLKDRRTSVEELKFMLLSVSDDLRVVLLSLCDRLVLLQSAERMPTDEARRVAQDVLHLFAPVAARLGIYSLKQQLEELAFPIVYPTDAEALTEQLQRVHTDHPDVLENLTNVVTAFLNQEGVQLDIEGREKQRYSIFRKLREKSVSSMQGIYDLFAVRVLVDSPEQCYQTLGHLHRLGRPLGNRFKDYVAFPKPNGYRSLHTTLCELPGLPQGIFLEVQIRTKEMHHEAQFGVAAHWLYKEGASTERALQAAKVMGTLALQETLDDEWSGMAQLADHIFVLTPRGDVIELPEGATPLDFAFTVHSNLGLHFQAARVNGTVVPINHVLQNGDVVDIQKRNTPQPSTRWLMLLKMSSARAKLKKYLLSQERPEHIVLGRALLNEELKRHGLESLDSDLSILRTMEGSGLAFAEREDTVVKVGQGAEKAASVLSRCDALRGVFVPSKLQNVRRRVTMATHDASLAIEGDIPLPVRFAKCCKPDAGTRGELLGIVSRLAVVMVHRAHCRMAQQSTPSRRVGIMWE